MFLTFAEKSELLDALFASVFTALLPLVIPDPVGKRESLGKGLSHGQIGSDKKSASEAQYTQIHKPQRDAPMLSINFESS